MRWWVGLAVAAVILDPSVAASAGTKFRIAIMPSEEPGREIRKYGDVPLYFQIRSSEIKDVELTVSKSYPEALKLFRSGEIDGMFAGSFVAAVLIKRGEAAPVVRPVLFDGRSTYRALVVAPKGTARFAGVQDLKGKRVAYCGLASAGEIFARSLLAAGEKPESVFTPLVTGTHREALLVLREGKADYAIVKNLVWAASEFSGLAVVGEDPAENPNLALILTPAAHKKYAEEVARVFLKIEMDSSFGALEMKKALGARGFTRTKEEDFSQTFETMRKAHIDPRALGL